MQRAQYLKNINKLANSYEATSMDNYVGMYTRFLVGVGVGVVANSFLKMSQHFISPRCRVLERSGPNQNFYFLAQLITTDMRD